MNMRKRHVALAAVLSGSWLFAQSASAHESVVHANTTAEIIDAINAANSSGVATLVKVAPGQYNFTDSFEAGSFRTLIPPITGKVTVVGKSAETTAFAARSGPARFFTVFAGGSLHIKRLTLSGARAECADETCSENAGGGAVGNFGGDLRIKECVLSRNGAYGSEAGASTAGGAVISRDGTLTIENSELTDNVAQGGGGAIALIRGSGIIKRSKISGNRLVVQYYNGGDINGGGISVAAGRLDILHSTISGNAAGSELDEWVGFGAGISNRGGTVSIVKSAIVENAALPLGVGAGIYNNQGTLTVQDSTVAANTAGTSGGGIYNAGTLRLKGATVARNDAQNMVSPGGENGLRDFPSGCTVGNLDPCISGGGGIWIEGAGAVQSVRSVIGSNTIAGSKFRDFGPDCRGTLTSIGYTALGDSTDCEVVRAPGLPPHSVDRIGIDPQLGELQDNGESGYPHLPILPGSPLIDAGGRVSRLCGPRDQIGQHRVDGDANLTVRCDIGAIEYQP